MPLLYPLLFLAGAIIGFAVPSQDQNFSAALPGATAVFETSLAAPITSSATSLTLTTNSVRGGGSISGYNCFTIDEGTAQAETVCGTVSSTAVTSITRGISQATGTTTDSDLQFSHRRGANVKITDFPIIQILKALANGEDTYPNILKYTSHPTFTATTDIVDKKYVDDAAFSGAAVIDATTAARGVVELATQIEAASSTANGSSGVLVIPASVSTSTWNSATAALRVVITQNNGKIDNNFLSTSTLFTNPTFSGNVTITPTSIFDSSGNQVLWTFIASTSLDSAQTVTFTARQHLRGYIHSEGVTSGTGRVCLRFNGDSAINYAYNASTTVVTGQTSLCLDTAAGGDRVSDHFFEIINPSNTSKRVIGFTTQGISSSTVPMPVTIAGVWATSTAQQINKITVPPDNAFRTGSVFYLYGSSY